MDSEVKSGVRTSEFWFAFSAVIGLLTTAAASANQWVQLAAVVGAVILGCVLGWGYVRGRTELKAKAVKAKAVEAKAGEAKAGGQAVAGLQVLERLLPGQGSEED